MVFGFFLLVVGYALFYWGWHHFSGKRYSLWVLLGFGSLFKNLSMPPGTPVQYQTAGASTGQTQQQVPSNNQTGNNVTGRSPVTGGLVMGRTDQGVDWSGKGQVVAVGAGVITNVYNSGWPGGTFITLKLDNATGLASNTVYYAEDITPSVKVGQRVQKGQVLGQAYGGPSGIEIGWADPNRLGQALAANFGGYKEGVPTSLGQNFKNWISGASST